MFGRGRSLSMTKYCGRENSLFDDPKFNDHKVLVVKGSIFWTLKTLGSAWMRGKWERKESERKENREERKQGRKYNPPVAWMEEGKHGGKKMGIYQND